MNSETSVKADIAPTKKVSMIWFVPLIAVFIGLWMVYYEWSTQGPLITIEFTNAEGMQAGKTKLKARNVDIGEVKSIKLNEETDGVSVMLRVSKSAEYLLHEDSQFWLVSPKVSHTGISGLETLISGVYIEMLSGSSENNATEFIALPEAPLTPPGTPGLHLTLNSNDQFAYSKGDPIIYKGLTVGQFEDVHFNFEERIVYYNAFIHAPYHQLITSNTRFWDASGLRIDFTADGVSMQTGNIETMLTNGVTFSVPEGMPLGQRIDQREFFDIYADYEAADDQRYKFSYEFVVLVSDTIRGLSVGAPVEYRGVKVGEVLNTNLLANKPSDQMIKHGFKIPILISMQPGRVGLPDDKHGVALMAKQNKLWIRDGLKAMLKTGNLLTGSLFVDLQHYHEQPVANIPLYDDYFVIPSLQSEFSQLASKAENFMSTLNELPLDQMFANGDVLLLELTDTAQELRSVSQEFSDLLDDIEQEDLSKQISNVLDSITLLTQDYSEGSQTYEELNSSLSSLNHLMHELKPLLNKLSKKPNSLIFDSGNKNEIEPKKQSGAQQ